MTISERLFSELDSRKLTAYGLCQALGINTTTTTNWKQRKTDPPAKYIIPICEFLGCSVEYLLTGCDAGRETKNEPPARISGREQELLNYFNQLGEYEQGFLVGEARGLLLASGGQGEKATG